MISRLKKIFTLYGQEILSVFCVVWLHNSYYMQQLVPGIYRTILPLFFSIIAFYFNGRKINVFFINRKKMFLLTILVIHYTITVTVMADYANLKELLPGYISVIFTIIAACLLSENISLDKFIKVFTIVVFWICLISSVLFLLEQFTPQVLNLIPDPFVIKISSLYGGDSKVILYSFYQTARDCGYFRNHGIFVEPGMFQIYINLALIFQLFFIKKINFLYIIIYLVGIATCSSTTGLVISLLIMIIFLLNVKTWQSRKNIIFIIFIIISVLIISSFDFISETVMFNLNKISQLSDNAGYGTISSGAERKRALIVAFRCWQRSPLLGVGPALNRFVLDEVGRKVILTFTPINWFTIMGLIPGLIFNGLLFKFVSRIGKCSLEIVAIWVIVLALISTQSMEMNLFLVFICFLGLNGGKRKLVVKS